ncbi:MAG TPA: fused MFS/spermidine synthase [Pseudolabrys sp.]|nr:fused MFS/spermidine synthase [Pseudolabrys sp.]
MAFVAAILVSAALLFAVEPMFTKMVLPRLGGSASVWSVAMVFFQAALLAGYAYAHLLTRFAPGRSSVVIHLAVMVVACFVLPLRIATGWGAPPPVGEAFWLLGLFAVSIGLPFFALAANAPLLQAWFIRTGHWSARDPYFLYAASNAGSFLALLSYPVIVEPFLRLSEQTWGWTLGFYVLILFIAACGLFLLRLSDRPTFAASSGAADAAAARPAEAAPPEWRDVAYWVALAAVPSGLLIAVTAHISTDVAAVPLLWVGPLALYLLTFVIVFQTRPIIPHRLVVDIQPLFILGVVVVLIVLEIDSIINLVAIHLAVFFVCTLMCHGELAQRRPAPEHLTAYYMWISAGGMIGGIAAGLIAPHLFNWVAEYPILIVLTVLLRPGLAMPARGTGQYPLFVILGLAALLLIVVTVLNLEFEDSTFNVMTGLLLGLTVRFWRTPLPFAAVIAFLFAANHYFTEVTSIYSVRNFFGVLNVKDSTDGRFRVLWHGATAHGAQRIRDDEGNPLSGRPEMTSEFFIGGGIDQVFEAVRGRVAGPINYVVIGLGTGNLACERRPSDALTYYELDPDIVRIASNPKLFNFVSECAPQAPIMLGDARLRLADAPDGSYDLIFIDAFIGAAIPIHLLTREAMALYLRKLKPHGVVAMHLSNYHLELISVAAGAAQANGAIARAYLGGDMEEDADQLHWIPKVAAIARRDEDFGALAMSKFWPLRARDPNQRVWTDDYSNIFGSIVRNLQE